MTATSRTILLWLALAFAPATLADTTDATPFDLSRYQGKVVVLDFWASWCGPCRRSFPWLNEMHAKYEDQGLVIIGVNLDHSEEDAAAFLAEFPADFQIHYDREMHLAQKFEVQAMPSSYVIGRTGEVKARHLGFKVKRQDEYEAVLVEALNEEASE